MDTVFREFSLRTCSVLKLRKFSLMFMDPRSVIRYSVFNKLNSLNSPHGYAKLSKRCAHVYNYSACHSFIRGKIS